MLTGIMNNGEKFTQEINNIVRLNGLSVLEAIMLLCNENDMDVQDIIPLLGSTLKEKIRIEAIERRMIKDQREIATLF